MIVRRVLRLVARLVPAVLILVAGGMNAAARFGIWPRDPLRDFWIFAVALVIAFVQTVALAVSKFRDENVRAKAQGIEKVVAALLQTVQEDTGVSIFDVGVSVFDVSVARRERVRRVYRFRLSTLQYSGNVKWVKGKGAVGAALLDGKAHHLDWRTAYKNYGKKPKMTQEAFTKVPLKYRSSFTLEEFQSIVDRYAEVLATPIVRGATGEVVGVLSIDLALGCPGAGTLLNRDPVREAAAHAGTIISNLWAPKE